MGVIGKPYRVLYEGRLDLNTGNFRTGLTDVHAIALKPNGAQAGVFMMPELPSPFEGRYAFNYLTSFADPEGEYMIAIFSPTEGIQTTLRVSLYNVPPAPTPGTDSDLITGTLQDTTEGVEGQLLDLETMAGQTVDDEPLTGESGDAGEVDANVADADSTTGQLSTDEIEGELDND